MVNWHPLVQLKTYSFATRPETSVVVNVAREAFGFPPETEYRATVGLWFSSSRCKASFSVTLCNTYPELLLPVVKACADGKLVVTANPAL